MGRAIKLNETQLKKLIAESVKKALNEIDFSSMPKGDYNERNNWWKQQLDKDYPEHGIQKSKDWQQEYNRVSVQTDAKKKQDDKEKKQKEKLLRAQEKRMNYERKRRLRHMALSIALEGTEDSYDGIVEKWPVVMVDGGEERIIKVDTPDITSNGYSGFYKINGQYVDVCFENCEIWVDDSTGKPTVEVELGDVTGEGEDGKQYQFDVEKTRLLLQRVFQKQMNKNLRMLLSNE